MTISARSAKKEVTNLIDLKHVCLLHDYQLMVTSEKNGTLASKQHKKRILSDIKSAGFTTDGFDVLLAAFAQISVSVKHRTHNKVTEGEVPLLSYAFDKCNSLEWKF